MTDATQAYAEPVKLHVATILVASRRALGNALDALGFAEDDDRVIEHDGRIGFVTCSHTDDADDMYAIIAELVRSQETWEIHTRVDLEDGTAVFNTLARHESPAAARAEVREELELDDERASELDLEPKDGVKRLRKFLKGVAPETVFIEIRSAAGGRAAGAIILKSSRQVIARAVAPDERQLAARIMEALPGAILSIPGRPRD
jgi:hypothetical protein